jgi:hypothetical protein
MYMGMLGYFVELEAFIPRGGRRELMKPSIHHLLDDNEA